jgi:predicted nucleic-acid-binding protein
VVRGVDTNVLVRFFANDDRRQSLRARALIRSFTAEEPAFISSIVMAELFWVLRRGLGYSREQICALIEPLLRKEEVCFEHQDAVLYALHLYRSGRADFADALLGRVARENGCETTCTFDKQAALLPDFSEV